MSHSISRLTALSTAFDEILARLTPAKSAGAAALEREVTDWFMELRDPLLRYMLSLGLPVQEGEDVAQEVFLALFRHLRDGKPRDNLRGWIFRVAHNLALKRRAAIGRESTPADWAGASVPDPKPDPEALAGWNREQSRLQSIYRALPERDRNCLVLRAEGLRYREIASALDMSLGSVAQSLSRSLAKLAAESARR